MMSIDLGERCYCADVEYPMAVVGTAGRGIAIYTLEGQPKEFKRIEPPLKYQHRCISIFKDKKNQPTGERKVHFSMHIVKKISFRLLSKEENVHD